MDLDFPATLTEFVQTRLETTRCLGPRAITGFLEDMPQQLRGYFQLIDEETLWKFFRIYFNELEIFRVEEPELVELYTSDPCDGMDIRLAMIQVALEKTLMLIEHKLKKVSHERTVYR